LPRPRPSAAFASAFLRLASPLALPAARAISARSSSVNRPFRPAALALPAALPTSVRRSADRFSAVRPTPYYANRTLTMLQQVFD
jgi:hypothetical protein